MPTLYGHTQRGYVLSTVLVAVAIVGLFALAEVMWLAAICAVASIAGAWLMRSLTIEVGSGQVRWWLGTRLMKEKIVLDDLEAAEPVKLSKWSGWGLVWAPGSVTYTLAGCDAVRLRLKSGKTVQLGTDQPQQLLAAIRAHATSYPADSQDS